MNQDFVLDEEPVVGGQLWVIQRISGNNRLLKQVDATPSAFEFTRSGANITVGTAPGASDPLFSLLQTDLARAEGLNVVSGNRNGTNVTYTLASAPPTNSNVILILFGASGGIIFEEVLAAPGAQQFTISGSTLTLGAAPAATETLIAYTEEDAQAIFARLELVGQQNSANTRFSFGADYNPPAGYEPGLVVSLQGLLRQEVASLPTATQFARIDRSSIRLGTAPAPTDSLQVFNLYVVQSTANPYVLTCDKVTQRAGIWTQRKLDQVELEEVVQQEYRQLTETEEWSHLFIEGFITIRGTREGGTVTVNNGSRVVIGSGTAFTAEDKGSRFRTGTLDESYEIINVDPTTQLLEINPAFVGNDGTGQTYTVYKNIYSLGSEAVNVFTMNSRYSMKMVSLSALDRMDPTRAGTSDVLTIYAHRGINSSNQMEIEVYPVPTEDTVIRWTGIRRDICEGGDHILRGLESLLIYMAVSSAMMVITAKTGNSEPWSDLATKYFQKAEAIKERLLSLDLSRSDVAFVQRMRDTGFFIDSRYAAEHDTLFWWWTEV